MKSNREPQYDLEGAFRRRSERSETVAKGPDHSWQYLTAHIGHAYELGEREADLVYATLREIRHRLNDDRPTAAIRALLADFLGRLVDRKDYGLGLEVLGKAPASTVGAPQKDKKVLWWEAHSNYEYCIEQGQSDEEALRMTWETFYPDKDFDVESRKPAGVNTTAYKQQIEAIKSKLNARGSRQPAKKGRKPKEITP